MRLRTLHLKDIIHPSIVGMHKIEELTEKHAACGLSGFSRKYSDFTCEDIRAVM